MEVTIDRLAAKDALLEATLPNVLFDGWSDAALENAGQAIGLDAEAVSLLFPGGGAAAREWLDDWADRRMVSALAGLDLTALRTPQRIEAALGARLDVLAPHREAVRRAMATRLSPTGPLTAARAVYRTVDTIWYAAGDRSTDFNFYTKRALLGAVHASTMLYWLNDSSDGAIDTREFIARRLADVARIPSPGTGVRTALRSLSNPFDVLRRELRR